MLPEVKKKSSKKFRFSVSFDFSCSLLSKYSTIFLCKSPDFFFKFGFKKLNWHPCYEIRFLLFFNASIVV